MKFKYKAITISGNEQIGKIEASDADKAVEILQKHKLVVLSVVPTKDTFSLSRIISLVLKRVSSKKIVIFSKELSILLSSGVSLIEALRIQYDQEDHPVFKEQIYSVIEMVDDGETFSDAISVFPNTFSDFYVNIVRSGEASGMMQESLMHLSEYVEKNYMLQSKVKNALMYPAVIIFGFAVIGVAMMVFVVPQLTAIFKENQVELPITTRALIFTSDFLRDNFLLFLVMVIVSAYLLKVYAKTKKGKKKIDTLLLSLPPFKDLFRKFYVARFADNFSILVGSGVPIINALQISGDVAGNEVYRSVIYDSVDEVSVGGTIAYAFDRSDYVPVMMSKMIKIGEKTGKLDSVLRNVADFYTKEVDIAVDGLTAIIEPILLFVLGLGVAVLVGAIMMPIYQMSEFV